MNSPFQMLMVAAALVSCAKPTSFEIHVSYRSVEDPERQYEVYTVGAYPPAADMADTYRGYILVNMGGARHRLAMNAENFTPKVDQIDSQAEFPDVTGHLIDARLLTKFIRAIENTASWEQLAVEAKELFSVLEAAGMGPKVGLPDTKALILVSVSNEYY